MRIEDALKEWQSKKRRMGCVSAARWFCKRVKGFVPIRKRFYYQNGNDKNGLFWEHIIAYNGLIEIDISPYARVVKEYARQYI